MLGDPLTPNRMGMVRCHRLGRARNRGRYGRDGRVSVMAVIRDFPDRDNENDASRPAVTDASVTSVCARGDLPSLPSVDKRTGQAGGAMDFSVRRQRDGITHIHRDK